MRYIFPAYIIYLLILSFITFVLYGSDKKKAKKGAYRTPEKVLLLSSFFGGAFGGGIAMRVFHHKTKHWYFHVVNIAGILLHTALIVFLFLKTR